VLPDFLQSEARFNARFDQQLLKLVEVDVLGVFILALANLGFSAASFAQHRSRLQQRFDQLSDFYRDPAKQAQAAADDWSVFVQLQQHGFDWLQACEYRQTGDWVLQFNRLRSLRPKRNANAQILQLQQDFEPDKFHFNKPFLRQEDLWQGEIAGQTVRLMFNKFPFAARHLLLLLQPQLERPQYLNKSAINAISAVGQALQQALPRLAICYNSLGAYASVNHQHFQLMMDDDLPIEKPHWQHNGGTQAYPVPVVVTDNADQAWQWLAARHEQNQAYNLIIRQQRYYLIARKMQGRCQKPAWSEGLGWSELAGHWSVNQNEPFQSLAGADLTSQLQHLQPD